ncbi:MAG: hypothetical protein RL318_349 [Fibrobacterota bacterium]
MNFALLVLATLHGSDPWTLVERSERARQVPMDATVRTTFWREGKSHEGKSMRFRILQDKDFLRIEPLDGKGPKLWEHHGQIKGRGGRPMPLPPKPPEGMELELAKRNYDAVVERTDSVAGRLCDVVRLRPRHVGGNGRRLCIDPATGIALRRDQYSERGELLRRSTIESIQHLNPTAKAAPPNPEGPASPGQPAPSKPLSPAEAQQWLGFEVPQATWAPDGFVATGIEAHTCPEGGHAVRLGWTDGLAHFSVFVNPVGCMPPMEPKEPGTWKRIARWFHSEKDHRRPPMVKANLGPHTELMAMGDISRNLLNRVLLSMGTSSLPVHIVTSSKPDHRRDP